MILQELHALQDKHGYLPKEALRELARRLKVPLYRIQEVAGFYPHFRTEGSSEVGKNVEVMVCHDMACHLRGGDRMLAELQGKLRDESGISVRPVSCLGRCDRPVACCINDHFPADRRKHLPTDPAHNGNAHDDHEHNRQHVYLGRTVEELEKIARDAVRQHWAPQDDDAAWNKAASRRWLIDVYNAELWDKAPAKKYAAAEQFFRSPEKVELKVGNLKKAGLLSEKEAGGKADDELIASTRAAALILGLKKANLRGMGGAGQAAFEKWRDLIQARGAIKYVVCNADESEPTTFKDRDLLIHAPHLVVEGVILAGMVAGAARGYIYIRHEYQEQIAAVREAIREADARHREAFETERPFPVEVFVSPGGYVCGEQSALIEAIEDRRSQPRPKPPKLETNGLYDKPTLVSNVETYAWVPAVYLRGAEWYANEGQPESAKLNGNADFVHGNGLRFYSLCGDVKRPGVFEVASGITLRKLIELAGGMIDQRPLKAFAPSGPSGGFVPARVPRRQLPKDWETKLPAYFVEKLKGTAGDDFDLLDVPLDLDCMRSLRMMLGAGMMVYADGANMVEQALNCHEFFRNETCGKCVPCRIGSQKMVDVSQLLLDGRIAPDEVKAWKETIAELDRAMELTSICGLGAVASKPLAGVLSQFPRDVAACTERVAARS